MEKKKFYITTPIYYTSGNLHIGHCYTTVVCDALARFKKMDGFDVYFLTGTDEHGQKVQERAEAIGLQPKQYVDSLVVEIQKLWKTLNVKNDDFIRTTDERHAKVVQKIFEKLYNKGDIYKSTYEGWYCTPCESYFTDSQLVNGKCPDCGREVVKNTEECYKFRLSKYQKQLEDLYENNPNFLQPRSRANEMMNNFIKPGLTDLAVSRTNFSWGVPVPFDTKHVIYVWIDALVNYISALGYTSDDETLYNRFWPASLHMVGKEIVRFHAIVWPALLMALDLPLPEQVYAHGWLLMGGDKISKSKGSAVLPPEVLCQRYGVDTIRYFLLREIPFGSDGNYTNEALLTRANSDLANDLGNLVSRTTAMITQYFDGFIPKPVFDSSIDFDNELIGLTTNLYQEVSQDIEKLNVPSALQHIFKVVQRANKYIDETMPWALAKDESKKERLGTVLYNIAEAIRVVAIMIKPFLPQTAQAIYGRVCQAKIPEDFASVKEFGQLKVGGKVIKADALFPRYDIKKEFIAIDELEIELQKEKENKMKTNEKPNAKAEESNDEFITIDDFKKVQLVTGKVVDCEKIPKKDKLLKLSVDIKSEVRTIVSGIANYYKPEDLIGKTVVIVKNLKPVKLGGVMSNGMVLCVDSADDVVFVTPEKEVGEGLEVR